MARSYLGLAVLSKDGVCLVGQSFGKKIWNVEVVLVGILFFLLLSLSFFGLFP